jgi:probable rRNA maturation factor
VIAVRIANRQKTLPIDRRRIRRALQAVFRDAGIADARISVAIVDDASIARLHGEFLNDPTPTDVLTFVLEQSPRALEGEIVLSADMARNNAARYRCLACDELLRYVIHGALHLAGYDDATPREQTIMRKRERAYLSQADVMGFDKRNR